MNINTLVLVASISLLIVLPLTQGFRGIENGSFAETLGLAGVCATGAIVRGILNHILILTEVYYKYKPQDRKTLP